MWYLISCGCAECAFGGDTILEIEIHDTQEAAKAAAAYGERTWKPHPQGGEYVLGSSGEDWVISAEDFKALKNPER